MKKWIQSTTTFWIGWSATFIAIFTSLVPQLPGKWQIAGLVGVLAVAALIAVRDVLIQKDRKKLEAVRGVLESIDTWEKSFEQVQADYRMLVKRVDLLDTAKIAAEVSKDKEPFGLVRNSLAESARSKEEDWRAARIERDATLTELQELRQNLIKLTRTAVTLTHDVDPDLNNHKRNRSPA